MNSEQRICHSQRNIERSKRRIIMSFKQHGSELKPTWYFPLAEVRKKRKMISHTLLGPDNSRVLEGGAGLY